MIQTTIPITSDIITIPRILLIFHLELSIQQPCSVDTNLKLLWQALVNIKDIWATPPKGVNTTVQALNSVQLCYKHQCWGSSIQSITFWLNIRRRRFQTTQRDRFMKSRKHKEHWQFTRVGPTKGKIVHLIEMGALTIHCCLIFCLCSIGLKPRLFSIVSLYSWYLALGSNPDRPTDGEYIKIKTLPETKNFLHNSRWECK